MGSILYSCIILTFLFLIWSIGDFIRFKEKLAKMNTILEHLTWDIHDMPLADNVLEGKYQEVVEELYKTVKDNVGLLEKSHADQMEYYTMWVHQIKTPISAMGLSLQNHNDADVPLIKQELFKIEQYVEMALQYVKINKLSSDLVIQEYALAGIVNYSVKKYAPLFIYKKISLELSEIDAKIQTDSKWLSFVIEQLISNSIKYTNQGSIKIYMKEEALIIEDTGMGIRAEDIKRIFEKGYTGYNGRIDKKASGIGLYLVKKVCDNLAIGIEIQSKVSVGTKAIVTFPRADMLFD
jgi:signal transduction histidine kinase